MACHQECIIPHRVEPVSPRGLWCCTLVSGAAAVSDSLHLHWVLLMEQAQLRVAPPGACCCVAEEETGGDKERLLCRLAAGLGVCAWQSGCGWEGSLLPCVCGACPQRDVLPGVPLLSHLEGTGLFLAGKELCHWRGPGEVTAGSMLAGEMVEGECRGQRCCVRSWEQGLILLPFLSLCSGSLLPQQ